MCQCWFINCSSSTLVQDVWWWGKCVCLCVCVGIGYIGSLLCSIQFCYCPETSLKSKVYCKYAWAWIHRYTHSTISFINSKYQSDISSDNLLSKMKCTVSIKYTLDFRFSTKEYKISHYCSLLITCWNGNIFDILVKYQNFTFFFFFDSTMQLLGS